MVMRTLASIVSRQPRVYVYDGKTMFPLENGHNGQRRLERLETAVERLASAALTLAEQMSAMTSHSQAVNELLAKLADAQLRLINTQSRLTDAQLKFVETQNVTEERLNMLINLVNELLRRLPPPETASSDAS
jgi:predicted transcriptional regulator